MCLLFSQSCLTLRPHGLQHARPPCPSPSPGPCSNSYTLILSCHSTISSTVFPFSPCPQSIPASGYFSISPFFTSDGPSIGASVSASVLPLNIQDWFPLGLTGWISLQSKGLSRVFSSTTVQKHKVFGDQPSLTLYMTMYMSCTYLYMTTLKTIALTVWTIVGKVMFLHFNMMSRFVIAFLPKSKHLLILWLQLPFAVIFEPKKIKSVIVSIFSPFAMK